MIRHPRPALLAEHHPNRETIMLYASHCETLAGIDRPRGSLYGYDFALQLLRHTGTGAHYLRHRYFAAETQQDVAYPLSGSEVEVVRTALSQPDADPVAVERDLLTMVGEPDGGAVRAALDYRMAS